MKLLKIELQRFELCTIKFIKVENKLGCQAQTKCIYFYSESLLLAITNSKQMVALASKNSQMSVYQETDIKWRAKSQSLISHIGILLRLLDFNF